MAFVYWCADVANYCRSRLQWGAADWPQEGRPDSKGGLLGGEVMLRLDLMPAFQVHLHNCCYHFSTVALQLSCFEQACTHAACAIFHPSCGRLFSALDIQVSVLLCYVIGMLSVLNMESTVVSMYPVYIHCCISALI